MNKSMLAARAFVAALVVFQFGLPARAEQLSKPVYTAAQAKAGEMAYMENCSVCHGSNLNNGMSDGAPALTGAVFAQQWGGKTLDELFTFTSANMPLNAPRSLSPSTYASIVAFLLSKSGIPPGNIELPSDVLRLKKISGPK